MKNEELISVSKIKAGDHIRFEHQKKHRRVMYAIPMSGNMTMIIIPGHDNFLRENNAVVYRKKMNE